MQTGIHSIQVIFGPNRRLLVPLYQRPYVWSQQHQWEPLWEDIRTLADRVLADQPIRSHFLGAIVLDQVLNPMGHLESRMIIDGQQRLATIQIILEAFADICSTFGADRHHMAMVGFTRNNDPLSDNPDDQYKVWPTNVDREQFRRVMEAPSPASLLANNLPSPHLIADAYVFFRAAIAKWLTAGESDVAKRIEVLFNVLRQSVRMVVIDLENEDDAQLIFETLNARGTPLLPSDLVKNFLLRRAELDHENIDALYERHWKPFDLDAGYWRQELGPGHAKRARIDLYLQNYLTLKKADEVPVAHLYAAYREYAKNTQKASAHLESLHAYSNIYRTFDSSDPSTPMGRFFRRLGQMDITTAYPLLLELFASYGDNHPQVLQVLTYLESFLVRRTVCILPTRAYNRLFIDVLRELPGEPEGLSTRVKEFLLKSDAVATRWPHDQEFREAWLDVPLFQRLRRQRVFLLLEALERQMTSAYTETVNIANMKNLTIEHLLPQDWSASWPLPEGLPTDQAEARRNRLLHTMGNLTLLTDRLNPKVSNGPWGAKHPAIRKYSALALNRDLDPYQDWGEDTIVRRGEALFREATKIWPFPVH